MRATLSLMFWIVTTTAFGIGGFVVVPRVGFVLSGAPKPSRALALPWLASALFVVAWWLPNPDLGGRTNTFTQHAVGGGAACAVIGLFLAANVGVRPMVLRVLLAYALAASLGTAMELFELAVDELRGTSFTTDSAWDLLANSVGAVTAALCLEAVFLHQRARSFARL